MKCEKCSIEILEGNLCESCKNNSQNIENQTQTIVEEQSNLDVKAPEQYDPVADLMNENVEQTVNKEKSELENAIPLGDNNNIPLTPVNENVVSVTPAPTIEVQKEVQHEQTETQVVEQSTQPIQEQSQQVTQTNQMPVVEKKKTKTSTIVIIVVAVVLTIFIIFFVLPLINSVKQVDGMFNQAKAATFVTEVQQIMEKSKNSFMKDALENPATSITYTNLGNGEQNAVKTIDGYDAGNKTYYVELDRNGNYQKIVVFDEEYCYDTNNESMSNFSKIDVNTNSIYLRGKEDSKNGCTGSKPQM